MAMLWEASDRGFDGGFVDSGKELTGVVLGKIAPWFNRITQRYNTQFVKNSQDAYMMNM